jgi:hypothetical protein
MPEVKFIEYKKKQVLTMDFNGITSAEVLSGLVDESIRLAQAANARRSVLAIIDLNHTPINRDAIASLKRLSQNNGQYIKAIAFVGLGLLPRTMLRTLFRLAKKKNHKVMRDRSQALAWLVQQ